MIDVSVLQERERGACPAKNAPHSRPLPKINLTFVSNIATHADARVSKCPGNNHLITVA